MMISPLFIDMICNRSPHQANNLFVERRRTTGTSARLARARRSRMPPLPDTDNEEVLWDHFEEENEVSKQGQPDCPRASPRSVLSLIRFSCVVRSGLDRLLRSHAGRADLCRRCAGEMAGPREGTRQRRKRSRLGVDDEWG